MSEMAGVETPLIIGVDVFLDSVELPPELRDQGIAEFGAEEYYDDEEF